MVPGTVWITLCMRTEMELLLEHNWNNGTRDEQGGPKVRKMAGVFFTISKLFYQIWSYPKIWVISFGDKSFFEALLKIAPSLTLHQKEDL